MGTVTAVKWHALVQNCHVLKLKLLFDSVSICKGNLLPIFPTKDHVRIQFRPVTRDPHSARTQPLNCRMVAAFVSRADYITSFTPESMTAIEIASLWTSVPIYFVLFIVGELLSVTGG